MNAEQRRLAEARAGVRPWRRWGAYLAERQWGTVREDYSADGEPWSYFPYEMALARSYRWGEDGLAGISDDRQLLCLALALWNGRDPHLKERLFGLSGPEGNHGEDVKEVYAHLDATPSHSYLKFLYKYPQTEFPYARLREANRARTRSEPELELVDTGVFDGDRYFDVVVEIAKADAEEVLYRIEAVNRGAAPARLDILPQLWFRNVWSWGDGGARPCLRGDGGTIVVEHPELGTMYLATEPGAELLFCDNDTHAARLWGAGAARGYFKDGIHEAVVRGRREAVNPEGTGTRLAVRHRFEIAPGATVVVRVRLGRTRPGRPFDGFEEVFERRRVEADEFFAGLATASADPELARLQRGAWAGLIWSQQWYHLDLRRWLAGDPGQPTPPESRLRGRNHEWFHLDNADVVSMPDAWEFPWYAAWDLAFHCLPLARLDPDFAKRQLLLLTREWYMHPNGQLPAYEWSFGDANPPVHAWAAFRVYEIDRAASGRGDLDFLERIFHKLMLNFTWWVNRKDVEGRNVFEGGFLGLDNIGVFDRSAPLPSGGHVLQADATSWMAMYSLNLMRIALELAQEDHVYEDIATKFFEHFLYIAAAMRNLGGRGLDLWDEREEFFYDVLRRPDGSATPLEVRSMVGLIPLFAVEILEPDLLARVPDFAARLRWFLDHRPDLAALVSRWHEPGRGDRRLLSLLRGHRMKRVLRRLLDEREFLSAHGVRSLSRWHLAHPYRVELDGRGYTVAYEPGEAETGLFGGNSNWRGPVWMPVNFLIVESLRRFHDYYGPEFRVECPSGSGNLVSLDEAAGEIAGRLTRLFRPGPDGRRPAAEALGRFATDPHFRDLPVFPEYFDGDTGRGLGAWQQTGWTALIAELVR